MILVDIDKAIFVAEDDSPLWDDMVREFGDPTVPEQRGASE